MLAYLLYTQRCCQFAPTYPDILLAITPSLASSFQKLAMLEAVKLDGCQITSSGMLAIGSSCNSLKELSLSKCSGVTDEGLSYVVTKHKHLKKLDITCCRKITDTSIASITSSCKALTSPRMESCSLVSKHAFCLIAEQCHMLEELDLTDNDLDNQGLGSISSCHKLSTLKIGLCLNVDDEGIIQIGQGSAQLEEGKEQNQNHEVYCSQMTQQSSISRSLSKGRRRRFIQAFRGSGLQGLVRRGVAQTHRHKWYPSTIESFVLSIITER